MNAMTVRTGHYTMSSFIIWYMCLCPFKQHDSFILFDCYAFGFEPLWSRCT